MNFSFAALALLSSIAGLGVCPPSDLAPCRDFQNETQFGTTRMIATRY